MAMDIIRAYNHLLAVLLVLHLEAARFLSLGFRSKFLRSTRIGILLAMWSLRWAHPPADQAAALRTRSSALCPVAERTRINRSVEIPRVLAFAMAVTRVRDGPARS